MTATEKPDVIESSASAPIIIGIHAVLPPLSFWLPCGLECSMLSHLLSSALERRFLLTKSITLTAFKGQIFGLGTVSKTGPALATIAQQLASVELLSAAHLAWLEPGYGWRTERPLPPPAPFESHCDAFAAWCDKEKNFALEQAEQLQSLSAKMVANLKKGLPPLAP